MDTIDFRPATGELARLVAGVRYERLDQPTPCTRYAVADLVEHISGLAAGGDDVVAQKTAIPPLPVPDGASELDRLVALTGREPSWRPRERGVPEVQE